MNWNDIDNIFKDGLYGHKVPFDESSWQKMESMLPPEKSSKRFVYWPAAAIISVLSISVAATAWFSWTKSTNHYVERNETFFEKYAKERSLAIDEMIREFIRAEQIAENEIQIAQYQNIVEAKVIVKSNETSKTQNSGEASLTKGLLASANSELKDKDNQELEAAIFIGYKSDLNLNLADVGGNIIHLKEFKQPKARKKHSVGIVGGINFSKGFASGSQADNFGVNPYGGAFYQHYFSKRWSVYSAIQYQVRNAIGTSRVVSTTSYNFGKEQNTLRVLNRNLHYLEMPILMNYRIGSALHIVAGASIAYVVDGSSEIQHEFNNEFESWTKSEKSFGHLDGINRFDAAIQAGVEYEFTQKLALGGMMHYGLLNVLDNAHFNKTLSDQNLMFRISAKYHLFRF